MDKHDGINKKIMINGKKDMTSGRCYEVCLAKEHYYQIKIAVAIVVLSLQKKKKKSWFLEASRGHFNTNNGHQRASCCFRTHEKDQ